MLQETRDSLNISIHNIRHYDNKCNRLLKDDFNGTGKEWEKLYFTARDAWENNIDELEHEINTIWYRNLDKSVQKSLNYYLRKAGLKTRKITALF